MHVKICVSVWTNFISSCLEDSSSLLADRLLQTFLTRMSIENEVFSEFLTDIIKDKKSDFNAKIVAIDLLTRVDKPSSVEIISDIFPQTPVWEEACQNKSPEWLCGRR